MTSWSLRVLGLTSTLKPCGTSSLEASPMKHHRLTLSLARYQFRIDQILDRLDLF
ncbi:hypothetical protein CFP56_018009 [Quercus suber]|uniref:Uncharacterized protein n=1 Tax=Quercus suber TaxID=58331 RepID=A0AAW0KJA9_QUESU